MNYGDEKKGLHVVVGNSCLALTGCCLAKHANLSSLPCHVHGELGSARGLLFAPEVAAKRLERFTSLTSVRPYLTEKILRVDGTVCFPFAAPATSSSMSLQGSSMTSSLCSYCDNVVHPSFLAKSRMSGHYNYWGLETVCEGHFFA